MSRKYDDNSGVDRSSKEVDKGYNHSHHKEELKVVENLTSKPERKNRVATEAKNKQAEAPTGVLVEAGGATIRAATN